MLRSGFDEKRTMWKMNIRFYLQFMYRNYTITLKTASFNVSVLYLDYTKNSLCIPAWSCGTTWNYGAMMHAKRDDCTEIMKI